MRKIMVILDCMYIFILPYSIFKQQLRVRLRNLPPDSSTVLAVPRRDASWTSSYVTGCVENREGNLSDTPDFRDLYLSIPALPKNNLKLGFTYF